MAVSSASVLLGSFYQEVRDRRSAITPKNLTTLDLNVGSSNDTVTTATSLLDKLDTDDKIVLCLHGIIFLLALIGNGLVSLYFFVYFPVFLVHVPGLSIVGTQVYSLLHWVAYVHSRYKF